MKILQIFPGKVWGGAEQYILDLGMALQQAGHEVEYFCRPAAAVTSRLDGRVKYQAARFGGCRDARSIALLAQSMTDADVVHIHDLSFASMAAEARRRSGSRARIVLTRHIARASRTMPWKRSSLRSVDSLLFVSELGKRLWLGANSWFPARRCHAIHNSIPPALLAADAPDIRRLYDIDRSTPIVMYTGRVRKSKGCGVLLEALARVADLPWQMVYVGACKPADYGHRLMKQAEKLGIAHRIHIHGFTPDARSLAAQADIGVAPSIVREAFGLSPVEFMQLGKCVISTDNGAQPEYITSGTDGLLVAPGSVDQLAGALRLVLSDPALRAKLAYAASERFRSRMTYDIFLQKILSIYNS